MDQDRFCSDEDVVGLYTAVLLAALRSVAPVAKVELWPGSVKPVARVELWPGSYDCAHSRGTVARRLEPTAASC